MEEGTEPPPRLTKNLRQRICNGLLEWHSSWRPGPAQQHYFLSLPLEHVLRLVQNIVCVCFTDCLAVQRKPSVL